MYECIKWNPLLYTIILKGNKRGHCSTMYGLLFSPTGYSDCFHIFPIVNSIYTDIPLRDWHESLGHTKQSKIAELHCDYVAYWGYSILFS